MQYSKKHFSPRSQIRFQDGNKLFDHMNTCSVKLTCGMMDNLLLRSLSPICCMLISSMFIAPVGSAKRNKVDSSDDLPAPVRPTTPI